MDFFGHHYGRMAQQPDKSPYNTAAVNAGGTTVDRVWNDKYYLEPIPAGQILIDPNLTQNPGW